ncbi:MAG: TerB family tellurite resistance protein, partial [Spirochaetaceae bacterium]|nr:TerB family tellurite resistance protein [Spirochaetaceae bacterium]
QYFRSETAQSLEEKLQAQGINYPQDLTSLQPLIIETMKKQSPVFQKRSLAVCLTLAMSDGLVDQQEMNLLNHLCGELGLSMHEVDLFREKKLKEVDESGDYMDLEDLSPQERQVKIDLIPRNAALALITLAAFADDDPSENEIALTREYFNGADADSLMDQCEKAGVVFPEDLPRIKDSIIKSLKTLSRQDQLKYLTLLYKTAMADGRLDPREEVLIEEFSLEFTIGLEEMKRCSPNLESLFRR